jgi:hypothetical protein
MPRLFFLGISDATGTLPCHGPILLLREVSPPAIAIPVLMDATVAPLIAADTCCHTFVSGIQVSIFTILFQ